MLQATGAMGWIFALLFAMLCAVVIYSYLRLVDAISRDGDRWREFIATTLEILKDIEAKHDQPTRPVH